MLLALDARIAAETPAGRGRVVRELLRALAALPDDGTRYRLLARERWDGAPLDDRFAWQVGGPAGPAWSLWAAARARGADAVLATGSHLVAALAPVRRTASTVYDLVAYEDDDTPAPGARLERVSLPLAVARRSALWCISDATKDALTERLPRAARLARTVPCGVEPRFFATEEDAALARAALDLPPRFVLSLATLEPRKNLRRAVEAVAALEDPAVPLLLAGGRGWGTEELDAALGAHRDRVRVLGFVDDDLLPGLLRAADVLLFPSLQEGFGLPVLEAMAAGTAVVTSATSSLPEVLGPDAGLLVDPRDTAAIRDAVRAFLSDEARRGACAQAGRERARTFTWEATARGVLDLLSARA